MCFPWLCSRTRWRDSDVHRACLRLRHLCQLCIVKEALLVAGSIVYATVQRTLTGFSCALLFSSAFLLVLSPPTRVDCDAIDWHRELYSVDDECDVRWCGRSDTKDAGRFRDQFRLQPRLFVVWSGVAVSSSCRILLMRRSIDKDILIFLWRPW